MKNLSSWLIAIFAFLFWGFRVVATTLYAMGKELVLTPMDMTMEISIIVYNISYVYVLYQKENY